MSKPTFTSHQRGFTLVEIAIVLVIVGLLLGGVLKGQELITQAKIRNIANELQGTIAAVYAYQDRYRRLPGDDPGAKRWKTGDNNPVQHGNSDGMIGSPNTGYAPANGENARFWLHLRLAGFLGGDTSTDSEGSKAPINAVGGITGVQHGGLGLAGTILCTGSLPAKIAEALDSQLDDGNAMTGTVRAVPETAAPTPIDASPPADNYIDDGKQLYVLCKQV